MVQSLIRSGEAGSVSEAKALLREYRLQRVKADKFANVEMARETDLDGFIKDPIEAYTRYIQKASSRLALLREFGSTPEVALSQAMIRHVKESRDPASLRKTRDFINAVTGAAYEDGIIDQATKWGVGKAAFFSIGLLLQHSFIIQPSVMFNVGGIAGYRNLIKGIGKVLPSLWGNKDGAANKRWAELAGVLSFTVNRELNDIIMEDKTRAGVDRILRTFGITQVDASMRIVTAIVGKLYTVDLANKWALTGDLKAKN